MAVVDDSDAVSRFEAALAAHRRLNAREDALADAQRAALERAESHDLAPPTPPVQARELQQLLDEFEAHAPAEETKTEKPPPKVVKGSGGGVYGRAARRNASCAAVAHCVGQQRYVAAHNSCEQPSCSAFFQELDEAEGACRWRRCGTARATLAAPLHTRP